MVGQECLVLVFVVHRMHFLVSCKYCSLGLLSSLVRSTKYGQEETYQNGTLHLLWKLNQLTELTILCDGCQPTLISSIDELIRTTEPRWWPIELRYCKQNKCWDGIDKNDHGYLFNWLQHDNVNSKRACWVVKLSNWPTYYINYLFKYSNFMTSIACSINDPVYFSYLWKPFGHVMLLDDHGNLISNGIHQLQKW